MINLLLFQAPPQCFSHMLWRSLGTSLRLNIAQINEFLKPLCIQKTVLTDMLKSIQTELH